MLPKTAYLLSMYWCIRLSVRFCTPDHEETETAKVSLSQVFEAVVGGVNPTAHSTQQ
jgi:hypothetical protein